MAVQQASRSTGSARPAPAAAKRNWLAEIRTEVKARPTAAIIYGVPGVGKTSMAANAPGAVFLTDDKEDGITTLKAYGLAPNVPQLPAAGSWGDVLGILEALTTGEQQFKTLVVDALGGIERLMHEEVCRRDYSSEWGEKGFGSYQKGFETSLADWRQFINALDRLRDEKQMSVILLAHAKVAPFRNPEGLDYDRYTPDVHAKTWSLTHKWADLVVFANFLTFVQGSKDGDKTKKGKSSGGQERMLYTEHHASYDGKNRMNLPAEIPMGDSGSEAWSNLVEAIKAGRQQNQAA